MPLGITKDCFPAPTKCHNCERKESSNVKKETDPKKDLKRCSNCHLVTYCDKDCQREHWMRVHKKHCKFLSGNALVKNAKHDAATCPRCIEQNQASPMQLENENSPKTFCSIEKVTIAMKKALNQAFGFHGDGKNCDCSLQFACELPFPLGEVSGQYVEIGSTGLDTMLAHSLKILGAMLIKAKKVENKNALIQLWKDIIRERSQLWYNILVRGMPGFLPTLKHLSDQVDSLQTVYGASNPWWKTLKFSVVFGLTTHLNQQSNSFDSHNLEDSRFQNLKLLQDYRQSQLQNQAMVCENKTWPNFLVWPGVANGSLAVPLPPGTRCQSCNAELCGEAAVSDHEVNFKTLPCLVPEVSDNGGLMACCPIAKNPSCLKNCLFQDVKRRMGSDEDQWKEFVKEDKLFGIKSRYCDFCLKWSLSSHRCKACHTAQYCSTVCQKKDLDFHMSVCATWAKDESRRILSPGKQKDHWRSVLGGQ